MKTPEVTQAPVDPETGAFVRNWPTLDDLRSDAKRAAKRVADDKDSSGEWTWGAISRYGNRYADGSPILGPADIESV